MGVLERKAREKAQTRRMILDSAMNLFIENGYHSVSMRRIAKEIEYSPATIYLYFKDKDEILYYLHEESFEYFRDFLRPCLSIKHPGERLVKMAELYVQFALENPQRYELMFIMKAPMRKLETEWECAYESFNWLKQATQECADQNIIVANNVEVAALALWSQVHGFASMVVCGRTLMLPDADPAEISRPVLEFFKKNLNM